MRHAVGVGALLALATGCDPAETGEGPTLGATSAHLLSENSLSPNGLSTNGLSTNGLSTNGLSTNGLSTAGLSTLAFLLWFNTSPPTYSDMVMTYVVRCAVAAGQTRTWIQPGTGVTYTWHGGLGLTPGWASGLPATEAEQQLITACLAAHVNTYGVHVSLSILGLDALAQPIAIGSDELTLYPEREACFFGNLFTSEGVYSGGERVLDDAESTPRACGLTQEAPGLSVDCLPLLHVGTCAADAQCTPDPSGTFYVSCTRNGKTYRPITTRLQSAQIYQCGDGTCQVSERCGAGATYDSCLADCGLCP